jgi:hypothetical protein
MQGYGEWFIMLFAGVLLLIWLYRAFYRWLHEPAVMNRAKLGKGGTIAANDANAALLVREGYDVVSGKHVIPIGIDLDGSPLEPGSRLYIDYIAERDGHTYIVKTARDRMPIDWSASGVRDRLLVYSLLLPQCDGVLYIDAKEGRIRKIEFHLE